MRIVHSFNFVAALLQVALNTQSEVAAVSVAHSFRFHTVLYLSYYTVSIRFSLSMEMVAG